MNPLMRQKPNSSIQQALGQFKRDPISALKQAGYNIPNGMNNPQQIAGYLMDSGQLNNTKLGRISQMARQMGLIR